MDGIFEFIWLVVGFALFVATIVAIGTASSATRKATMAAQEVRQLQQHVAWLDGWLRSVVTQLAYAEAERARIAAPAAPAAPVEVPKPSVEPTPALVEALAPPEPGAQAREAVPAPPMPTSPEPLPVAAAARAPAPDLTPAASPATLEEQLGIVWLTRVGAAVFVLGALFFFKYAVDNSWIGPMGRVAIGGLTGIALLVGAELTRPKTKPAFVSALTGIGLAVLFAAVWASSAFYNLVSPTTAFVANTAVLLLGAALAARHKAETTLVVSLGAGLLNPVVLSTGKDQPVALFAYLVLITSVTMVVASHLRIEDAAKPDEPHGFRVAPWIAVVGTIAIFVGWYVRFFDISDRRHQGIDAPAETLVGPYLSLSSRASPLIFVFVTAAEWIAAGFWYRARHREGRFEVVLAVIALVVGHVTSTMVLYDSPRALGGAAILLGVGSIVVLARLRATQLLLVPMGAAFVALLAVSGRVEPSARITLIGVLGAWAAVYVVGLLRDSAISRMAAWRASAALGLFLCLSAIVLVRSNPALFVLVVAAITATVLVLAHKSKEEPLLGAISVVALVFVWITSAFEGYSVADVPWALLGAAALVTVVVLAGAVLFLRRSFGAWVLLAVSAATLGSVGAVVLATWSEVSMLRALAAAGAGVVDLAIGAWVLRERRDGDLRHANLLVGQALALFAAAVAFSQAGATITVLWALLAVVAASAAAKTMEPEWLVIALGFYVVSVGRALLVDTVTTWHITSSFLTTMGREGELSVAAFRNARAYGLVASGLSLLAGARLIARDTPTPEPTAAPAPFTGQAFDRRPIAAAMVVLAYVLLVAMLIIEVRVAATKLPLPPGIPLDYGEWDAFQQILDKALAEQRGALSMFTTLVLGVSASVLLVVGFATRDALHRYLGLVTFTLALGKLAVWDVWMIERIYQIVLFIGTGGLLVAGGFLYARFGKRIVKLVREGTTVGVVLLVLTAARSAEAAPHFDTTHAAWVRAIDPVAGPGDYRLEVDLDLYRQSRSAALLADVRIVDEQQREVPYVLQAIDTVHPPPPVVADFLDPGTSPDGTAVATWKMSGGPHCRVKLELRGENFVRRVRVETGDTVTSLHTVSDTAYVFKVEAPSSVERAEVTYPRSLATFVRVTLAADETRSSHVAIRGGIFSCEPPWAMPATQSVPLKVEEMHTDEAKKTTIVTLDAGAGGAPLTALTLDVEGSEFRRTVSIDATNYREAWPSAGSGQIYRLRPRPSALLESLRLPLSSSKRWFRLEIANEDSAPLVVRGVVAEVATRQIVFRATSAGKHRLFVGDPSGNAPRYDLENILAQQEDAPPAPHLALAAAIPNPQLGEQPKPPDPPFTEQHRKAIGIALAFLLGALSLWAVRLLRKPA